MIHYALTCERQHQFDGWFSSAGAFEQQHADGVVTCPLCHSAQVEKAPMAPAVARADAGRMRAALRALRDNLVSQSENVGDNFAGEARKIHYEEAPARTIHGRASRDEVSDLLDDGIAFMPLPDLPDDHN